VLLKRNFFAMLPVNPLEVDGFNGGGMSTL
jgi:hypothetical protein